MPGKEPNTMMIKILGKKEYASVSSDALDVLLEVHDGKTTSRPIKKTCGRRENHWFFCSLL